MSRTTGPILAVGAITLANRSIVHNHPIDWRIPIATGAAAGLFALAERGWERGAVALSWLALVSVLFARLDPKTPAPAESLLSWWTGQPVQIAPPADRYRRFGLLPPDASRVLRWGYLP